ncbi:MAG: hypothetical protein LiPW41_528 [Parcubacteria group bacterium LiPW_41]|nr:MAG: hypothetical protein LiPW41_528 [Parcubacteria group bacterium LiPW_41]
MEEFSLIEDLAAAMKLKLDATTNKKKVVALYAFNSTGKTRLSNILNGPEGETDGDSEDSEKASLCYNVFLEDMFQWDNESYVLSFDQNSWIGKLITEQGLEDNIADSFNEIVDSKVEPSFDFSRGEVTFNIVSGDDASATNIKISRGEESVFIWSFFYAILKTAIEALNTDEAHRTTSVFNNLKYIIIDDPVSSIDDTKIITIAIKLIKIIKANENNSVKFFITTHHALFYNVLVNSFNGDGECNFKSYSLLKDNHILKLSKQGDAPFSYHLLVKEIIQNAITNDSMERYHFNLFRNLLEKTSNFLGYNNWSDCISGDNKQKFTRLLNLYSHSRISDLESRQLSSEDKTLLRETFNTFITDFKWN